MGYDLRGKAIYPIGEIVDQAEFPLSQYINSEALPTLFGNLYFTEAYFYHDGETTISSIRLVFENELALTMPGTDKFALVFGSTGTGWTSVGCKLILGAEPSLTFIDATLSLRLSDDILRDVETGANSHISVTGDIRFSTSGVMFSHVKGASLKPSYLLGTQIIVEADGVRPVFDSEEIPIFLGEQPDFLGIAFNLLSVTIPGEYLKLDGDNGLVFQVEDAFISSDGFTGSGIIKSEDLENPIGGELFGLLFRFREFRLDVRKNVITELALSTDIRLQALEDGVHENWIIFDFIFEPGNAITGRARGELHLGKGIRLHTVSGQPLLSLTLGIGSSAQYTFAVNALLEVHLLPETAGMPDLQVSGELKLRRKADGSFNVESFSATSEASNLTWELPGSISIEDAQATLSYDQAVEEVVIELGGNLTVSDFDFSLRITKVRMTIDPDSFTIELTDIEFGPLGTVDTAKLRVKSTPNSQTGERDISILLETTISWENLHSRLNLDDLPDEFPLPPDGAEITAFLSWESGKLVLRFSAEVADADSLWRFIPEEFRPQVDHFRFAFEAIYQNADEFTNSSTTNTFQGEVSAEVSFKLPPLPPLPGLDLFKIETGNEEGLIESALKAGIRPNPETGEDEPYIEMSITNPVSVDVNIPGMPQAQPPIHTAITAVGFDLSAGSESEGKFTMSGDFNLHPVNPPATLPMASHLKNLLSNLGIGDFAGMATFALEFKNGKAALSLDCKFTDAEVKIDVFHMIASLTRGFAPPDGGGTGNELPLDIEVSFGLRGIRLQLGSLEDASEASQFSLEMVMGFSLAGISAEIFFLLSDQEFALGLAEEFKVPLAIPRFPLGPEDLENLRDPNDPGNAWSFSRWDAHLNFLDNNISILGDGKLKARLQAQEFLLRNMKGIYELLSGPSNRQLYQTYVELLVGIFHATTSALHVESDIHLVLNGRRRTDGTINEHGVKFIIPFADPRGIGVHGSAHLAGFAPDDPFRALEEVNLGLGLSADQIFFSIESLGTPIPLPDFGRYPGGSVNLSRLRIGYGYTKNSFSMTFAGEMVLPPQLVEDADTSELIGAGIRLPTHNALSFKLDLIPVVLGAVDFIVPLFEFDLDLREPTSQALVSSHVCQPYWDGLQVIVPNIYHDALKHVAFSPLFSIMFIPNFRFDGDVMIGDEKNGLTVIMDNALVLIGYYSSGAFIPVPFFASPNEPYFDNLCVNIRLAGFGINFNLQRPFPSLSPLALFEVLGLLADPMMPIDPHGSLANTIRVSLTDAYVTIPQEVARMFPETSGAINKPLNITINLGTFITALQQAIQISGEIAKAMEDVNRDISRRVESLQRRPPVLSLGTLLTAIPPELRKFRLSGSFAGFDANALLLLIDANDFNSLKREFEHRDDPRPTPVKPSLALGAKSDPAEVSKFRPNLPARPGSGRTYYPDDPKDSLVKGMEFEAFSAEDLTAITLPFEIEPGQKPKAGVVVGAHVKVFSGQRFRFLGYLFEDGSFSLVTALDIEPLNLSVAGIPFSLPLEIHSRLTLTGRAKRDGYYGSIKASGRATWNIIPNVARLKIAKTGKPATLEVYSDGNFAVNGNANLSLFNGTASIDGTVDISHTHCFVQGMLNYEGGNIIELALDSRGRIGPGRQFEIGGGGSLKILGQELTEVKGVVTDKGAAFEARLNTGKWKIGATELDCTIDMTLKGMINLRKKHQPEFALEGASYLKVFGAEIDGRGGVKRINNKLSTFVEGSLRWQGREWLGGRIEVGDAGISVAGRTSFAINLTPSNIAGVQLASLFFKIDLEGSFTLNTQGGLAGFNLKGDWALAARLPGNNEQVFPLAMQKFSIQGNTTLEKELIHISGFKLLPFQGVQIPIPTIRGKTPPSPVRFGKKNNNMAASWEGTTVELIGGVFPVVYSGTLTSNETEVKVYLNYEIDFEEDGSDGIDINPSLTGDYRIFLFWTNNNKLAIKVKRSGKPDSVLNLS